jgi:quercetin dioxygenase-like cupin family protein
MIMALTVLLAAGTMSGAEKGPQMAAFAPEDIKWGPAPQGLPEGAVAAGLVGDPSKKGFFTVRLKTPAGYKVMPHSHPGPENVTVLEGMFYVGMGDTYDEAALKPYPAGSFISIPAGHRHFAYFRDGGTIQLSGNGPWGITYVNPQDDPRKTTKGR